MLINKETVLKGELPIFVFDQRKKENVKKL